MSTQNVKTQDIYEGAYLLTLDANILNVEVFPENKRLVCRFTFTGTDLLTAQNKYYNGKAEVNVWEFRRCFSRINALIGTARKEYNQKDASLQKEVS